MEIFQDKMLPICKISGSCYRQKAKYVSLHAFLELNLHRIMTPINDLLLFVFSACFVSIRFRGVA